MITEDFFQHMLINSKSVKFGFWSQAEQILKENKNPDSRIFVSPGYDRLKFTNQVPKNVSSC